MEESGSRHTRGRDGGLLGLLRSEFCGRCFCFLGRADRDHRGPERLGEGGQFRIGVQLLVGHDGEILDDGHGNLTVVVVKLKRQGAVEMAFAGRAERQQHLAALGEPRAQLALLQFGELHGTGALALAQVVFDEERFLVIGADQERQDRLVVGVGEQRLGRHLPGHAHVVQECRHSLYDQPVPLDRPVPDGVAVLVGAPDRGVLVVVEAGMPEQSHGRRLVRDVGEGADLCQRFFSHHPHRRVRIGLGELEQVRGGSRVADLAQDETDVLTHGDAVGPERDAKRQHGLFADADQRDHDLHAERRVVLRLDVVQPVDQQRHGVPAGAHQVEVHSGAFFKGAGEAGDAFRDLLLVGEPGFLGPCGQLQKLEHVLAHRGRALAHRLHVEPHAGEVAQGEGVGRGGAELQHLLELPHRFVVALVFERLHGVDQVASHCTRLIFILAACGRGEYETA